MVPATLPALPGDITDDAIARMGLDEFLVRFGGVTREIATQFSAMYSPSTSQQDPVIDLDMYISLMVTQQRPSVLLLLRQSYVEGIDYVTRAIPMTERHRHGGHLKKRVLLTPDCFKRLCMRSRTAAAETVRTYFLHMETLTRRYFGALAAKSQTNVGVLLGNQRNQPRGSSKSASASAMSAKDGLEQLMGDIYIFEVQGRVQNLFRVGSTVYFQRRMREHGSSHADSVEAHATRIRVCDARTVEQCFNVFMRHKKYRRGKEVYQADYETIKSTVMSCGRISAENAAAAAGLSAAAAAVLTPRVVGKGAPPTLGGELLSPGGGGGEAGGGPSATAGGASLVQL